MTISDKKAEFKTDMFSRLKEKSLEAIQTYKEQSQNKKVDEGVKAPFPLLKDEFVGHVVDVYNALYAKQVRWDEGNAEQQAKDHLTFFLKKLAKEMSNWKPVSEATKSIYDMDLNDHAYDLYEVISKSSDDKQAKRKVIGMLNDLVKDIPNWGVPSKKTAPKQPRKLLNKIITVLGMGVRSRDAEN